MATGNDKTAVEWAGKKTKTKRFFRRSATTLLQRSLKSVFHNPVKTELCAVVQVFISFCLTPELMRSPDTN